MVKGEMVIDVPYGVDILRLRLWGMSDIPPFPFAYSTRMAFQPIYQIFVAISKDRLVEGLAKGRGMRLGWLSRSMNRINHQANAAAKIRNVDRFDHAHFYLSWLLRKSRRAL
jgi:hypothetical protein